MKSLLAGRGGWWWKGGIALGLFALGTACGIAFTQQAEDTSAAFPFTAAELQAVATHGNENFAIATGPVADEAEGVFFLDYLTGELRLAVLNNRTQKFSAFFSRRIIGDLGVDDSKKPRYLLATGQLKIVGSTGAIRPGLCVAYVVDANTGNFAAYGIPWSPAEYARGTPINGALVLLDGGKARDIQSQ